MINQISAIELHAVMATTSVKLIDVREQWEFDGGHVPGAEWIPMALVPIRRQEFVSPDPVYVVCRTGARSGQVVAWLAQQGIRSINVHGGTEAWARQGYPISTAQTTERIR